jgi:hypothetical protein
MAESRRLRRLEARAANRAANTARSEAWLQEAERKRHARWLLKDLPAPSDREVTKRWVREVATRRDGDPVGFDTEHLLRMLDRATEVAMLQPTKAPELADAILVHLGPTLRDLPITARIAGGVLVPPLAHLARTFEAGVEVVAKSLCDDTLAPDIEAVRVYLRAKKPVVVAPA